MHRVETDEVRRLLRKAGEIIGIQPYAKDTADTVTWPEKIWLVVIVYINLAVETAVPAIGYGASVVEGSKDLIRAQGVVRHANLFRVAGHIELAVELGNVRGHRNAAFNLNLMELPVKEVLGDPYSASGAGHIPFISLLENGAVSAGVAAVSYNHREGVAISLGGGHKAPRQRQCYDCQSFKFHIRLKSICPDTGDKGK